MRTNSRGAIAFALSATLLAPLAARAGVEEGKAVYEKNCHICHTLNGEGGKMAEKGGPLDGIALKRDAAYFKEYLLDPKSKIPDSKMPKPKISAEEIDQVISFLQTLKTPAK